MQVSLLGEKVISGNNSLPGTGSLSNVNFPYKTSTLSSELPCVQFLKKISSR